MNQQTLQHCRGLVPLSATKKTLKNFAVYAPHERAPHHLPLHVRTGSPRPFTTKANLYFLIHQQLAATSRRFALYLDLPWPRYDPSLHSPRR
ncbi:MAG: hypothetical protein ACRD19_13215, partial [Terriglobia bacterium]